MTLDDIKKIHAIEQPPVDDDHPCGDKTRPWWVVAVNSLRQPVQPKFVAGFMTEKSAKAHADANQNDADAPKDSNGNPLPARPHKFYAVARPKDGEL